jgi:hypothetical protein
MSSPTWSTRLFLDQFGCILLMFGSAVTRNIT